MSAGRPAYLDLHESGELAERARRAQALLRRCVTCPRNCRVDRTAGELGVCRIGALGPGGELRPALRRGGAAGGAGRFGDHLLRRLQPGLRLLPELRHQPARARRPLLSGRRQPERIAEMMLSLQAAGCENINFVSAPATWCRRSSAAVALAVDGGLRLPLVYNSGGYDAVHTLRLLDGVVDIYMPDMKYSDDRGGRAAVGGGRLRRPEPCGRARDAPAGGRPGVGRAGSGAPRAAGAAPGAARRAGRDGGGGPLPRRGGLARHLHQRHGSVPAGLQGGAGRSRPAGGCPRMRRAFARRAARSTARRSTKCWPPACGGSTADRRRSDGRRIVRVEPYPIR